jgi:hypothetical protein
MIGAAWRARVTVRNRWAQVDIGSGCRGPGGVCLARCPDACRGPGPRGATTPAIAPRQAQPVRQCARPAWVAARQASIRCGDRLRYDGVRACPPRRAPGARRRSVKSQSRPDPGRSAAPAVRGPLLLVRRLMPLPVPLRPCLLRPGAGAQDVGSGLAQTPGRLTNPYTGCVWVGSAGCAGAGAAPTGPALACRKRSRAGSA